MPIILPGADIRLWSTAVQDVLPHAPECPLFEIEDRLRHAAREFCRKSFCWRSPNVTLLTTVADQAVYTYANPGQAELLQVHAAWNGTDEVDVGLPGETDDTAPDESASEWKVMRNSPTELRLTPPPDTAGIVLKGTVSYQPTLSSTGIPAAIFDDYRVEIAAGAAASLVIQPNKPWSNPAAYTGLYAMFCKGARRASNDSGPVRRKGLRVEPV